MIELLVEGIGNVEPMHKIMELATEIMEKKKSITVAEIGVGYGATSVEIVNNLRSTDTYYFFDFEHVVQELIQDLNNINSNKVKLVGVANSTKTYDSYAWNLAKMYVKLKESNEEKCFDVVYLDGAHTFLHDMSATSILKEMVTIGGYLVLDDVYWSLEKSPTCNPSVRPIIKEQYTDEQIKEYHINLMKQCLLDNDNRYTRVDNYRRIAIYQRNK